MAVVANYQFLCGMRHGNIVMLSLQHVSWQGIQQRQDSNDRHTWLRCKGHIANNESHAFPCERNSF